MTIVERVLELVADDSTIGLGSGRAQAFVRTFGERVRRGTIGVREVATSEVLISSIELENFCFRAALPTVGRYT